MPKPEGSGMDEHNVNVPSNAGAVVGPSAEILPFGPWLVAPITKFVPVLPGRALSVIKKPAASRSPGSVVGPMKMKVLSDRSYQRL